ncbi:thioesterase II family protein [Burkholderia sp. LMG 21824]|uniref:thioesterase II family protein n=1 Tax=Burkholderia sp. LMG 21824 TaxID=3158172 RepID=UPI003C2F8E3C
MTALLYCLPHAGGGGHQYLSLSSHLHPDVEWVPLDYPGHFSRADERLEHSLDGLAYTLSAEILAHASGRQFAVFGHSMGGALAFEIAHHVAARGADTLRVVMISSAAPPQRASHTAHEHFTLDDATFVRHLVDTGGLSEAAAANPALLRAVLPLIRHDYRLYFEHVPPARAPLDVPLTVFWGEAETALEPVMRAWADCSRGDFAGKRYPGGHFYWQSSTGELASDISASARHHMSAPLLRFSG